MSEPTISQLKAALEKGLTLKNLIPGLAVSGRLLVCFLECFQLFKGPVSNLGEAVEEQLLQA